MSELTEQEQQQYHRYIVTHELHRQRELLAMLCMLVADNKQDRARVQELLDKQDELDYTQDLVW